MKNYKEPASASHFQEAVQPLVMKDRKACLPPQLSGVFFLLEYWDHCLVQAAAIPKPSMGGKFGALQQFFCVDLGWSGTLNDKFSLRLRAVARRPVFLTVAVRAVSVSA